MARVAVIGGGVSGLAAAHTLATSGAIDPSQRQVVVFEAAAEVGGKARTVSKDGFLIEEGPQGFLLEPELRTLLAELDLAAELVEPQRSSRRRYIVREGEPREIPLHPLRFVTSGHLSFLSCLRLLGEPFVPRRKAPETESLYAFGRRRLGRGFAERLLEPMTLGVYAGRPRELCSEAFPRLVQLEREHGSIVKGMIRSRRDGARAGTLMSLRGGVGELSRRLAATEGVTVRTGSAVERLFRTNGGWSVGLPGGESYEADVVVLATEASIASRLLGANEDRRLEALAHELGAIDCAPVAVVAVAYDRIPPNAPVGYGALVPRGQGLRVLGCLWEHHVFEGRAPAGSALVRMIYGGAVDREAADLNDVDLKRLALEEAQHLLGASNPPKLLHVRRWRSGIPQYDLEHPRRRARIEELLREVPGLELAGNALDGVGFPKAVARGVAVGRETSQAILRADGPSVRVAATRP